MRKTKIGKREREVKTKNLPSNGEWKCLPTKTKRKTQNENRKSPEIGKGMRKTKTKTEIRKRERNEENKNRKEREVETKNLPSNGEWKCLPTEMQAETKKRVGDREKERVGRFPI